MQTMNQALLEACMGNELSREDALERSADPKELLEMFEKRGIEERVGRDRRNRAA
jgi:hypothetical protein